MFLKVKYAAIWLIYVYSLVSGENLSRSFKKSISMLFLKLTYDFFFHR